jgi:outer membrane protein assembly factor BamA
VGVPNAFPVSHLLCSPRGAWFIAAVALLSACPPLHSQPSHARQFEVSSISFEGNSTFSTGDLKGQIKTRETPGFFNKFLYNNISERLGRRNEYFDAILFGSDADRLRKYYENRGFSEVHIDTLVRFDFDKSCVDLTVQIKEGYRSIIQQVIYRGIVDQPPTVWEDIRKSPLITAGDPFVVSLVDEEVRRVLRAFADNGFPNAEFVRDSSSAQFFISSKNYTIRLEFRSGRRYLFGPITVMQEIDTLHGEQYRDDITDEIVTRQMDYEQGDFYSLTRRIRSEHNLNGLGIFDLRRIETFLPPAEDSTFEIPSRVTLRPRTKHEVAPELLVSDQDGAFNFGGGIGYTDRNFFGGARTFNPRIRFQTQTILSFPDYFKVDDDAVSNLDLTFEVVQPYIFTNRFKGTWSFSYILDKQKPYLQYIFRNKLGFSGRFAEYTTGVLEFTLENIDLRTNSNFTALQQNPEIKRELDYLEGRQFNSIISFTLQRDMTNDLFSPTSGFVHAMTVEEAGIIPIAIQKLVPTVPFTQFVRAMLVGRWYSDLTDHRFVVLASKLKAGIEDKYGESWKDSARAIPQTHRFYGGGGNSVRGWASRDLIASGEPLLGGNLSLEASIELRANLLQSLRDDLLDKVWLVSFLDVGNVWGNLRDFSFSAVAMATGIGLRYETPFGPFRLDWGIRVYNPAEAPGHRWITQRRLMGETFRDGVFHFGIGHAF